MLPTVDPFAEIVEGGEIDADAGPRASAGRDELGRRERDLHPDGNRDSAAIGPRLSGHERHRTSKFSRESPWTGTDGMKAISTFLNSVSPGLTLLLR